jgi:hypothetical protein
MFVRSYDLVYFAYPKCGSQFLREALGLTWDNHYPDNWQDSSLTYGHCKPSVFVAGHKIDVNNTTMFSVVRNPYDRILSAYFFGAIAGLAYAKDKTFRDFVKHIYDNRHALEQLPFCWMFLPIQEYFEGVLDHVKFFQMGNMQECLDWLDTSYGIKVTNKRINSLPHAHYSKYYDQATKDMVTVIYAYEIKRFGYRF